MRCAFPIIDWFRENIDIDASIKKKVSRMGGNLSYSFLSPVPKNFKLNLWTIRIAPAIWKFTRSPLKICFMSVN